MDKSNNSPNKKNFKRERLYCYTTVPTTGRPHEVPSTTFAHCLNDLNVTSRGFRSNHVRSQPTTVLTPKSCNAKHFHILCLHSVMNIK